MAPRKIIAIDDLDRDLSCPAVGVEYHHTTAVQ